MSGSASPINGQGSGTDHPVEKILACLPDATPNGSGWTATCPSHDDSKPSLSINEGDDGRVLLRCHAGCWYESIVTAIGLSPRDLFSNSANRDPRPKAVGARSTNSKQSPRLFATRDVAIESLERQFGPTDFRWPYQSVDGKVVGMVLRWDRPDGKVIRPIARRGEHWVIGAMAEPRPLYRLPFLDYDDPITYVTEGEKAADALSGIGVVATTSSAGAEAASKTDWTLLAGKRVTILPDNDPPGQKYAQTVAKILLGLTPPAEVKIVQLPELPLKGDAWDWIDACKSQSKESLVATLSKLNDAAPLVSCVGAHETKTVSGLNPASCVHSVTPETATLPWQPFPLDQVPSPLREFIAATSKSIDIDPCQIALPLFTAAGAAIGNTRRLHIQDNWNVPPILWTAVVAESGSGKTPALKEALRFTEDRQTKSLTLHEREMTDFQKKELKCEKSFARWRKDDKSSDDPPETPQKPILTMFRVTDCTIEALATVLHENPRGVLVGRDELSGWFHGHDRYARGNGDQSAYLEMYTGGSFSVIRKTSGRLFVSRASVCVTGTVQPGILRRLLGTEQRENGLQARFLFAFPERRIRGFPDNSVDPQVTDDVARVFHRLWDLDFDTTDECQPCPINLEMTPDATALFKENTMRLREEAFALSPDLHAAYSKLEEIPARLALIFHEIRAAANDPDLDDKFVVDAASIQAGIEVTRWCEHETRRVYAMLGNRFVTSDDDAVTEQSQRHLVEWIRKENRPLTARDVQMTLRRRYPTSEAAELALDDLADAGLGHWEDVETTSDGGRPTRRFRLEA